MSVRSPKNIGAPESQLCIIEEALRSFEDHVATVCDDAIATQLICAEAMCLAEVTSDPRLNGR